MDTLTRYMVDALIALTFAIFSWAQDPPPKEEPPPSQCERTTESGWCVAQAEE